MDALHPLVARGDVFWVPADALHPSVDGEPHPHVVIQCDVLNRSRITSVVVCALSSNPKRRHEPGNVVLDEGEANLPKPSTAVVSQISTVEKSRLGTYVGTLSAERVEQILAGMAFLQRTYFQR